MFLEVLLIAAMTPLVEKDDRDIRLHCQSQSTIGFGYSEDLGWKPTVFREQPAFVVSWDEKAIPVSAEKGFLAPGFIVREAGDETPWARCRPRGKYLRENISCDGGEEFSINLITLKYQSHFWGTYSHTTQVGESEQPDTPWVSIGTCTPF
jgi:hypothetical protein